jgi:hypothetical protein
MYPHRIRLRGPWECEPLTEPAPAPVRMTLPCRWGAGGLAGYAGRVRFQRRFGRPGRIDAHERVWLTFAGVEGAAEVTLNGRFLGQHTGSDAFEFEVTALLGVRNELSVEVEAADDTGGLWGEVALEVRCSAWLRGIRLETSRDGESAHLHVFGEVVGTADRPLELYVLLDGATVIYTTLVAEAVGRPFHVISEDLPPERWQVAHQVRVELVNAATVWHAMEIPFGYLR